MKVFWASIILFSALLSCVIFNACYIQKLEDRVTYFIDSLEKPVSRETHLSELEAYWYSHRDWLSLSVAYREVERLNELITEMRWAHEEQKEEEFQKYRSLFSDAIQEIADSEKISFNSVF